MSERFSDLGEDCSRPWEIVRVPQALSMDVPLRLRRERLTLMMEEALQRSGIEARLADRLPINPEDPPGIEAKALVLPTGGQLARKCVAYVPEEARPSLNEIRVELKRL
jgi:hypothetical protein